MKPFTVSQITFKGHLKSCQLSVDRLDFLVIIVQELCIYRGTGVGTVKSVIGCLKYKCFEIIEHQWVGSSVVPQCLAPMFTELLIQCAQEL